MDAIPENPPKGDATAKTANGTMATNITTTRTTLPVTTTLPKTNKPHFNSNSASTATSTFSNLLAGLAAHLTPLQTTIHNQLPESFTARLPPLVDACTTHLSAHPHLTTFVTIQLLFTGLPVLLFTLFAAGTILFSLVLALLGAAALSALVIGGAVLVLVPVAAAGAVLAGMTWIGCWIGWYGVVWVAVVFGSFGGSSPERRDGGMRGSDDDAVGMGRWEGKWEEWRRREKDREWERGSIGNGK
ncbi:hypothetical protein EMCG_01961 [[Emmonsia] crescens]|uniref:Uncharacterized protein n=1 Tax=[Emmonsia] crescens TaxID=73230 RepID=A0A0G2HZG6_9EURO|nr:hypothetical protein EMCG_01961 [Emmonsia crescens UAMH 3008]